MYNQLPSTILQNATTFDLMVVDVYATWEKSKADPTNQDLYSQDQLAEFMKSIRGE